MSTSMLTPTEALLHVAKSHPFRPAVRASGSQWSYAALWARIRHISDQIHHLDPSGSPIGLYMALEVDYVAAAHAIWLSGRTVVFLSNKWTPEVLSTVLARASVRLVLHGALSPPSQPIPSVSFVSTFSLIPSRSSAPAFLGAPSSSEIVDKIPVICSITPTSGSTGVPKSIVYPMRRSLAVLTEESSSLLKPMDGQWLRGGTTFLRPLFEIRRFMFNQTTLYLDASTSVADQCTALCEELESPRNAQLLRVHFTPSVFRAFADFSRMRSSGGVLSRGFNRVYWMVIGGESLSIRDLEIAREVFPSATIACNYACSEVGFAGISQMFVAPSDPMPSAISFGATQGCSALVLLDPATHRVIPQNATGSTGIVGFVTSQSATSYLGNEDATAHMFRMWEEEERLLWTDDVGQLMEDGTVVIKGRSSRNVKVNGLFVDLDYVERALAPAFAASPDALSSAVQVQGYKLVKSHTDDKIILFAATSSSSSSVLKAARSCLRSALGDDLAMVVHSVRCVEEMPFNASYKVDLAALQAMADVPAPPGLSASSTFDSEVQADDVSEEEESAVRDLAMTIAAEVTKLCKASEPVPTDMPLLYSGLNSITIVRLYFWLQSEHEYEEEMSHLFEEEVTAEVLAAEILSSQEYDEEEEEAGDDYEAEEEGVEEVIIEAENEAPFSPASQATVVEGEDDDVPKIIIDDMSGPEVEILPKSPYQMDSGFDSDKLSLDSAKAPPYSFEDTEGVKREGHVSVIVMQASPATASLIGAETVPESTNDVANHPTLHYGPLAFLFLTWMTPLMTLGAKRPLLESDLLPLRRSDEAIMVEKWTDRFWDQMRGWFFDRSKPLPALFGSIFGAASKNWLISGILWFISVASAILAPLMLQQIIVARTAPVIPTADGPAAVAAWTAAIKQSTGGFPLFVDSTYALAGILLAFKVTFTLSGRSADQIVKRMALNVKTVLISAVYKKALRLSAEGNQKYGKGYIMNIVNVDCESISKAVEVTHQVWSIPMQLIAVTVLLSRILGVSAWAGIGALFLALFVLIMVVPVFMRKAAPWFMRLGDKRLKTIREVLDGIRLVKVNGWEDHFIEKLEGIRTEQLRWLKQFNTGVACFVIVGQVTNTVMPLAAFSLFGHEEMGQVLSTRVFPALSFFGMLVDPLIALPQLLSAFVIAMTSFGRVYSFLIADEKSSMMMIEPSVISISPEAISITDASFSWPQNDSSAQPQAPAPKQAEKDEKKTSLEESGHVTVSIDLDNEKASIAEMEEEVPANRPFLHDINLNIMHGSLTAIVGTVGAGKSSLLSAIIGEMMRVNGDVSCTGSIAYCAQQAWVQTSTIQDNILFGRPLDVQQLQKAIQTTSFDSDLDTFPHGMATQMGEKGNNLSGGQKARLSLARAVYSDADIYLLDDVLAALDARVGRNVFNKCIKKALQGKTRLLVTHQLQYLNQVDHIIVVSEGTIVEQGSFHDLVRRNGELSRLLNEVQAFSKTSEELEEKRKSMVGPKKAVKQQEMPDQLIVEEERNTGHITAATWWAYIKATGGVSMALLLVGQMLLLQGGTVILNQWLTWWTEDSFAENVKWWIGIYNGIGWTTVVLLIIMNISVLLSTVRASRTFHSKALRGVLAAPMWWFEGQPIGRIMNRFSKDIESIDQRLMPQLFQLVAGTGSLISTTIILAYSTPVMIAILVPMMGIYWVVLRFYRKSLRELKRLESVQRGPLQSRISETLDGIPTIMAYKREHDFASAVGGLLDNANKPTFLRFNAEIWVTLRMEILSSFVVFILAMLAHTKAIGNSTQFSLALTYASTLTYIMNLLLKSAANVEAEMNSVERLIEYTESLPKEPPARLESDPPKAMWPTRGEIVLRDIEAAYPSRPDKLVLRDVSLTFNPGETVFIVGRTGSGKSTLLSLLLRMIEAGNGTVEIDGRDITSLGVSTLRQGMQVIPQDPFIFSGTIRSSLDFDGHHDDSTLWHALDLVGLKPFVSTQESKLDTKVEDNGSNYSVGQRQLLCLAAAILRNPKILLLDEATASIDAGADVFIQQAMRNSCPEATILSVMHRLSDRILEECDKVLVMEQGVPVEYASPRDLLSRPNSMFSKLMAAARNNS